MSRKGRARHTFGALLLALLALSLSGCSDAPAGPAPPDASPCDDRDRCPLGEVCTPLTWSCAEDGAPLECCENGAGWRPREPCAPGQHCDPETGWCLCGPCEVPVEGGCERVGPRCAEGWRDDGECGCEPVLGRNTAEEDLYGEEENYGCAENEIAQIGGGCTRVGAIDDCGEGTWGNIETDEDTIYVNGAYEGGDSNGSRERPFTKIQDAVDAVPEGLDEPRTIAIAEGRYVEGVIARRPVNIMGRCPSKVALIRRTGYQAGIMLSAHASSVESLTIDAHGGEFGIGLLKAKSLSIKNVVINTAYHDGIICQECEVNLTNISVKNIDERNQSDAGHGVEINPGSGTTCFLEVNRADILETSGGGIFVSNCPAKITNSRIRSTLKQGIYIQLTKHLATIYINNNSVKNSHFSGIGVESPYFSDTGIIDDVHIQRNRVSLISGVDTLEEGANPSAIRVAIAKGTANITENDISLSEFGGIYVNTDKTFLQHNSVSKVGVTGLRVDNAVNAAVKNNVVSHTILRDDDDDDEVYTQGILAALCNDVSIHHNIVRDTELGAGLLLAENTGDIMLAKNFVQSANTGINIQDSENGSIEVEKNYILDTAFGASIGRSYTSDIFVTENYIDSSKLFFLTEPFVIGLQVQQGRIATIEYNRIKVTLTSSPDTFWSRGIEIQDTAGWPQQNSIWGWGTEGILVITQTNDAPIGEVYVRDNHLFKGSNSGIYIERSDPGDPTFLENNVIAGISATLDPNENIFGDGIVVNHAAGAGATAVRNNCITSVERFGVFVSGADVTVEDNDIWGSHIAYGWQDGAEVTLGENHLHCNQRDDPAVDEGFSVPDPPPPPDTNFEY